MLMKTYIAKVTESNPDAKAISMAVEALRSDGLVIFPTETVYGIGCNAFSSKAALKIFMVKNRPPDNPLIVHVSDMDMLGQAVSEIPAAIMDNWKSFWPGPLTVILRKSERIPMEVTGGLDTVAVRIPSNRVALEIIRNLGSPVAAPSANISTKPSITDSRYAIKDFSGKVDVILDSGPSRYGLESSVIDIRKKRPLLLRSGAMTAEAISGIFGDLEIDNVARGLETSSKPVSPGTKYRHYSPECPVFLVKDMELFRRINKTYMHDARLFFIGVSESMDKNTKKAFTLGKMNDLSQAGSLIFKGLRELDNSGCRIGIIHPFPEHHEGLAIMNRVRKASSGTISSLEDLEFTLESL